MRLYIVAGKETDSVTHGFLPAAAALGLDVTLLTDRAWRAGGYPQVGERLPPTSGGAGQWKWGRPPGREGPRGVFRDGLRDGLRDGPRDGLQDRPQDRLRDQLRDGPRNQLRERPRDGLREEGPLPRSGAWSPATVRCDVTDVRSIVAAIARDGGKPAAIFSNSDHLQTPTALAAAYFGLPGKDWRATLRTKNKALMRRELGGVYAVELWPGDGPPGPTGAPEPPWPSEPPEPLGPSAPSRTSWPRRPPEPSGPPEPPQPPRPPRTPVGAPYPLVVKPREGVASEDVFLVGDAAELSARCREIWSRRPEPLVAEEYLPGELHTLETLNGRVLGGFRTRLSPPPHFVEERLDWVASPPCADQVLAALRTLGVGFGACHTEYVVHEGRARVVEVNYRIIGDHCDFLLADLLGVPIFEWVLRAHLGETPPPPPAVTGHAAVDSVIAGRSGTLATAPGREEHTTGGVRLTYWPVRAPGDTITLTRTNRDYLGLIRAIGPDAAAVEAAIRGFRARHTWEIVP